METSIKRPANALNAGLLYLALIIVGMFGFAYVLPQIQVDGNMAETALNIESSPFLLQLGATSILIMNIVSIALAIVLRRLFTPVDKKLADMMFYTLLVGATISLLNEINHFAALIVNTNTADFADSRVELTGLFIGMHHYGSYIASIFWGLWLFPLGALAYKLNTRISRFIGITLVIAGIGYVVDCTQLFLLDGGIRFDVVNYTFIGELFLTIWLLFRSKEVEKLSAQAAISG